MCLEDEEHVKGMILLTFEILTLSPSPQKNSLKFILSCEKKKASISDSNAYYDLQMTLISDVVVACLQTLFAYFMFYLSLLWQYFVVVVVQVEYQVTANVYLLSFSYVYYHIIIYLFVEHYSQHECQQTKQEYVFSMKNWKLSLKK